MELSIIIPVKDEEENVEQLVTEIKASVGSYTPGTELIFVDDGSTDNTLAKLWEMKYDSLIGLDIKIIKLRKNFGKSTALNVGFKEAKGRYIMMMDGDLQDDPAEIRRFFFRMEETDNPDCVVGWRYKRRDNLGKLIPSLFFNKLSAIMTGVKIHDANCGYKIFRKECVEHLKLYGELHRYIPALLHNKGFKVTELKIVHRKRLYGRSKYGLTRLVRGFIDLLTVMFLNKFSQRPAHFFSLIGLLTWFAGFLSGLYTLKIFFTSKRTSSWVIITVFFGLMGLLFILFGFIGELIINKDTGKYYVEKKW